MNPPSVVPTKGPPLEPSIILHYARDNNIIDFPLVYTQIKSLLKFSTCIHNKTPQSWPCGLCETVFLATYWPSAARLIDYFADFYATDTALMQSLWFHLLDIWQESAFVVIPKADNNTLFDVAGAANWHKAHKFQEEVEETKTLMKKVIGGSKTGDSVMHRPDGVKEGPCEQYETGPWVSGLKPWMQFLCKGSPGVAAPKSWHREVRGDGFVKTVIGSEHAGRGKGKQPAEDVVVDVDEKTKDKTHQQQQHQSTPMTRHIPLGAIAIIESHTNRARDFLATLISSTTDPSTLPTTTTLASFDLTSLKFPTPPKTTTSTTHQHSYTSAYTSHSTSTSQQLSQRTTYTLANGAPLISRPTDPEDPDMVVKAPDVYLLDECVGMLRGADLYVAVSGGGGGGQNGDDDDEDDGDDGDGDENEEGEIEDEGEAFDMWTVVQEGIVLGEGDGEGRMEFGEMWVE